MRIAIIGAGPTGLVAALKLTQKNHQVIIFEKEKYPGGLMAGFKNKGWDWPLERFYHHLFTSDKTAIRLINELDLKEKFFFKEPKTSIFKNKQINRFDSAISLIKFPYLSLKERIRAGIATLSLKLTDNWPELEKIKAKEGLIDLYGQKTYEVLWKPLLKGKFGKFYQQISMAWFWARIKKRSTSLGYLEGGFQILIDKLAEKIKQNGGQILLNHEIKNSNELIHWSKFDKVVFTTPTETFLKIMKDKLPQDYSKNKVLPKAGSYKQELSQFKMMGTINLVLSLKESFLTEGTYWLNINDKSYPFVAVVEHTNFIDKSHYNNQTILYVGGYYPQNHRYFKMPKEAILKEWLPYLQKINPKFNQLFPRSGIPLRGTIINYQLFSSLYAQPIVPINYSKNIPAHQTPIKNIYLANMQQICPWDRGLNYAIGMGKKIANLIENEEI